MLRMGATHIVIVDVIVVDVDTHTHTRLVCNSSPTTTMTTTHARHADWSDAFHVRFANVCVCVTYASSLARKLLT